MTRVATWARDVAGPLACEFDQRVAGGLLTGFEMAACAGRPLTELQQRDVVAAMLQARDGLEEAIALFAAVDQFLTSSKSRDGTEARGAGAALREALRRKCGLPGCMEMFQDGRRKAACDACVALARDAVEPQEKLV